ncbi:MAG: lipoprotein [Spirochaetia bacterium]|nr:lipoprotein [Spirochaetia bacterium]
MRKITVLLTLMLLLAGCTGEKNVRIKYVVETSSHNTVIIYNGADGYSHTTVETYFPWELEFTATTPYNAMLRTIVQDGPLPVTASVAVDGEIYKTETGVTGTAKIDFTIDRNF